MELEILTTTLEGRTRGERRGRLEGRGIGVENRGEGSWGVIGLGLVDEYDMSGMPRWLE